MSKIDLAYPTLNKRVYSGLIPAYGVWFMCGRTSPNLGVLFDTSLIFRNNWDMLPDFPPNLNEIYDKELATQLAHAQDALSGLKYRSLPNPYLLMRPLIGKEAESSAQLEGTQASLEDALKLNVVPQDETLRTEASEISNYQDAMMLGLDAVKARGLTNAVIRDVHKELLKGVRGRDKNPGEFRLDEVWIGAQGTPKSKARYVPPHPLQVPMLMRDLQDYYTANDGTHPLIMCAVLHHRFEAIHPFKDGNGRVGRLLISLFLISRGMITLPVLYPSGYFEKSREEYLERLKSVDRNADWSGWISYFLRGIETQAKLSLDLVNDIENLYDKFLGRLRGSQTQLKVVEAVSETFSQPYITVPLMASSLKIPNSTAHRYVQLFCEAGILKPGRGNTKPIIYSNNELLGILRKI